MIRVHIHIKGEVNSNFSVWPLDLVEASILSSGSSNVAVVIV